MQHPCPELNVHKASKHEAESVKYLGNIVTSYGGVAGTIEDRRNKGWGKVSAIQGILSEVDMGSQLVEVGFIQRKAILVSCLLFTRDLVSSPRLDNEKFTDPSVQLNFCCVLPKEDRTIRNEIA